MRDPNSNTIKNNTTSACMTPTTGPTRNIAVTSATRRATKYYFGLKDGESILVSVPLGFLEWRPHRQSGPMANI